MASAFYDSLDDDDPPPEDVAPPPLGEATEEWVEDLASEGVVTRSHKHNVGLFIRFCMGQGVTDFSRMTVRLCKRYVLMRQGVVSPKTGEKLSETTVRHEAITIRAFLHWCHKQGYVKSDRLYRWTLPKAHKPVVYMPTMAEQRVALRAIKDKWTVGINPRSRFRSEKLRLLFVARDQALVAVLMSTGMRVGEALRLKVESYNRERRELKIDQTKTDDPRSVPVTDALARYLDAWLRLRPRSCSTNYLFVTEYGKQMDVSAWGKQWQGYLTFARSQGHTLPRITLHSLRHSAATTMAKKDLKDAQELLGHRDLASTARYLHTTSDRVRATHAAVDPLAEIADKPHPNKRRTKIA